MDDVGSIETILGTVESFGLWVMFAILYMQEKRSHDATREKRISDLREFAGFRRIETTAQLSQSLLYQQPDNEE